MPGKPLLLRLWPSILERATRKVESQNEKERAAGIEELRDILAGRYQVSEPLRLDGRLAQRTEERQSPITLYALVLEKPRAGEVRFSQGKGSNRWSAWACDLSTPVQVSLSYEDWLAQIRAVPAPTKKRVKKETKA